ncbi:hypothetical protein F5Y02DRAFT_265730 [Annulohypoxylon stygium]|nr:hypothetical protein F5Y02DRAFT_265730 [Annulohypoxylon stygium]
MNPSWVCVPTRNIRKDELGRQSTDNQIFSKPPIGFDWILPCFAGEAGRLFLRALLLNGYRNVMWKKRKKPAQATRCVTVQWMMIVVVVVVSRAEGLYSIGPNRKALLPGLLSITYPVII